MKVLICQFCGCGAFHVIEQDNGTLTVQCVDCGCPINYIPLNEVKREGSE